MSPSRQDHEGEDLRESRDPLPVKTRVRDLRRDVEGVIVDHASQFAHPKAAPVFAYLVRWEDGQIHALSEFALSGHHDFEIIDS